MHAIPLQSALYKALEGVYHEHLYTATVDPPGIRRGKVLQDQVVGAEEGLKEKTGLAPQMAAAKEVQSN